MYKICFKHIHIHIFITYRYNTHSRVTISQLAWIAHWLEHCTGNRRVRVRFPFKPEKNFRLNFHNCLSCVHNCDGHSRRIFRDIVKMYTCLFLYDHLCDDKPCNFSISLVSEQHNCFTRSASTQQLSLPHSRIDIRKFCHTVIGKYYWNDLPLSVRNNSPKIIFNVCVCVCGVNVCTNRSFKISNKLFRY